MCCARLLPEVVLRLRRYAACFVGGDCRVIVFGGSGGRAAHILELRTWKLQPAGKLSSERQHMVRRHACVVVVLLLSKFEA